MTIHELCVALQSLEPEDDVFVALYVEDSAELFDIEGVRAHQGHTELEFYAEEAADDEAHTRVLSRYLLRPQLLTR